jgi:hypothetical protein
VCPPVKTVGAIRCPERPMVVAQQTPLTPPSVWTVADTRLLSRADGLSSCFALLVAENPRVRPSASDSAS